MKDQLGPALENIRGCIDRELTTATTPDSSVSSEHSEKLADLAVTKRSRLDLLWEHPPVERLLVTLSPLIEREGLEDRKKIAHLITSLQDEEAIRTWWLTLQLKAAMPKL